MQNGHMPKELQRTNVMIKFNAISPLMNSTNILKIYTYFDIQQDSSGEEHVFSSLNTVQRNPEETTVLRLLFSSLSPLDRRQMATNDINREIFSSTWHVSERMEV